MVCNRCRKIVMAEMDKLKIPYFTVELGEVNTTKKITSAQHKKLYVALKKSGLDLVDSHKNELIEKLKKAVFDLEQYTDENLKTDFSDYITLKVSDNFNRLNILFAEIEGITIEKYIIKRKIELVKKLLIYNDLNIKEIAQKMHYSSVAQLTSQFKSITGLTPLFFQQLQNKQTTNPDAN